MLGSPAVDEHLDVGARCRHELVDLLADRQDPLEAVDRVVLLIAHQGVGLARADRGRGLASAAFIGGLEREDRLGRPAVPLSVAPLSALVAVALKTLRLLLVVVALALSVLALLALLASALLGLALSALEAVQGVHLHGLRAGLLRVPAAAGGDERLHGGADHAVRRQALGVDEQVGAERHWRPLGDDGALDEVRQHFPRHLLELLDLLVPLGEPVQETDLVCAKVRLQDAIECGEHATLGDGVETLQEPPQGLDAVAVPHGLNEPQRGLFGQHHQCEEQLPGGGPLLRGHGCERDVAARRCLRGRDHRRVGAAQTHQVRSHLEVPLVPLSLVAGKDGGLAKASVQRLPATRERRGRRRGLSTQHLDLRIEVRHPLRVCASRLINKSTHRAFERPLLGFIKPKVANAIDRGVFLSRTLGYHAGAQFVMLHVFSPSAVSSQKGYG